MGAPLDRPLAVGARVLPATAPRGSPAIPQSAPWPSNGFVFCFVAGRIARPTMSWHTSVRWQLAGPNQRHAKRLNYSGKTSPDLTKLRSLRLDGTPQNVSAGPPLHQRVSRGSRASRTGVILTKASLE